MIYPELLAILPTLNEETIRRLRNTRRLKKKCKQIQWRSSESRDFISQIWRLFQRLKWQFHRPKKKKAKVTKQYGDCVQTTTENLYTSASGSKKMKRMNRHILRSLRWKIVKVANRINLNTCVCDSELLQELHVKLQTHIQRSTRKVRTRTYGKLNETIFQSKVIMGMWNDWNTIKHFIQLEYNRFCVCEEELTAAIELYEQLDGSNKIMQKEILSLALLCYNKQAIILYEISRGGWSIGSNALGKEVAGCIAGDGPTTNLPRAAKMRGIAQRQETDNSHENSRCRFNSGSELGKIEIKGLPHTGSGKFFIQKSTINEHAGLGLFARRDLYNGGSLYDANRKLLTLCCYNHSSHKEGSQYKIEVKDNGVTFSADGHVQTSSYARYANDGPEERDDNVKLRVINGKIWFCPNGVLIKQYDELLVGYGFDFWYKRWKYWSREQRIWILYKYKKSKDDADKMKGMSNLEIQLDNEKYDIDASVEIEADNELEITIAEVQAQELADSTIEEALDFTPIAVSSFTTRSQIYNFRDKEKAEAAPLPVLKNYQTAPKVKVTKFDTRNMFLKQDSTIWNDYCAEMNSRNMKVDNITYGPGGLNSITVMYINTNTLTIKKLILYLWYFKWRNADILFMCDVRQTLIGANSMIQEIKGRLGDATYVTHTIFKQKRAELQTQLSCACWRSNCGC